jgi:hypothetical protein
MALLWASLHAERSPDSKPSLKISGGPGVGTAVQAAKPVGVGTDPGIGVVSAQAGTTDPCFDYPATD